MVSFISQQFMVLQQSLVSTKKKKKKKKPQHSVFPVGVGLVTPRQVGSKFSNQEWDTRSLHWRQILNYWTSREIP